MSYALNEEYSLEGFYYKPFCLVNERDRFVREISRDEFDLLLLCDGSSASDNLTEKQNHMANHFAEHGVLTEVTADAGQGVREIEYELNDFLHMEIAQIAITGRCNLCCKHCLAAVDEHNVATQLTLEECQKIFADMIEARIFGLWLTGGEPLVHPQFKEIVCAATEYGLRLTRIFTNGSLITEEILDFLKEQNQHPEFVVSLDGLGTHDWMRNSEGAEKRTLAAIDFIQAQGFKVCVSVNVNGVTAPRVIETCRCLALDHGIRSIHPIYTSLTPRWYQFAQDKELLDIGQYYDLMIELLRISRMEHWPAVLDILNLPHVHMNPHPKAMEYLYNPPAPRKNKRVMVPCGRASFVVFIASDGRVLPCSAYEGETAAHGIMMSEGINVKTRPLKDIMGDSEYAEQFRMTIADLWASESECKDCKWVEICCGGCSLYRMERKLWDCGNPTCVLYKGGYATKYANMLKETMFEEFVPEEAFL